MKPKSAPRDRETSNVDTFSATGDVFSSTDATLTPSVTTLTTMLETGSGTTGSSTTGSTTSSTTGSSTISSTGVKSLAMYSSISLLNTGIYGDGSISLGMESMKPSAVYLTATLSVRNEPYLAIS